MSARSRLACMAAWYSNQAWMNEFHPFARANNNVGWVSSFCCSRPICHVKLKREKKIAFLVDDVNVSFIRLLFLTGQWRSSIYQQANTDNKQRFRWWIEMQMYKQPTFEETSLCFKSKRDYKIGQNIMTCSSIPKSSIFYYIISHYYLVIFQHNCLHSALI